MVNLQIEQIPASEMANFSYLVYCPETHQGAVVDPSMYPQRSLDRARELGIEIELLLNTHGHQDHIAGNSTILEQSQARWAGPAIELPQVDIPLEEGSCFELGQGQIQVLQTPGHTPGSLIFATGNNLITGDTLFVSRCGRADLPGSDVEALYNSLQRLKQLPAGNIIYPGHDYGPTPTSTIGQELEQNEFLKCPDLESFIKLRMG